MGDASDILEFGNYGLSKDAVKELYESPEVKKDIKKALAEKKERMSQKATRAELIYKINCMLEPVHDRAVEGGNAKDIKSALELITALGKLSGINLDDSSQINIQNINGMPPAMSAPKKPPIQILDYDS